MAYHVRVSPPGAGFLSFDTLTDLAAFPAAVFVPGLIVYVASPNTIWVFNPSSTATATGTGAASTVVAAVGGGNWIRVAAIEYDALLFGASAANADNATAINAAIVQANADGGGDVVLPEGTFTCLSTINLLSNVTLRGAGVNATTLNMAGAPAACVLANGQSYCALKSLAIESTGDGLDISALANNSNGFIAEDVSVDSWGATSFGICFIIPNANSIKVPRFRNVSAYSPPLIPGATCVGMSGAGAGQLVGCSWQAGRISGAGIGVSLTSSTTSSFSDLEIDDIENPGVSIAISSVNVGTATFSTAPTLHGLVVGQLVRVTAPGVTGLLQGATQVASVPTTTTFTLIGPSSFGGAYAGGGTATPANGLAISLGAGASGNFFKNTRVEHPAVDAYVSCDAASYANLVELSPALAPTTSQMVDASGTNILYGSDGSGGFIDTNPQPQNINIFYAVGAVPLIQQQPDTTTIKGVDFTVRPQQSTFAGGNNGGGYFTVDVQAPTGSGAEAGIKVTRGGAFVASLQPYVSAGATNSALYMVPGITPSSTNYTLAVSTTFTTLNAPTGSTFGLALNNVNQLSFTSSNFSIKSPIVGISGPLQLGSTTVPLTSGANTTLSAAQAANPDLKFTCAGGLLGAGTTVTFPTVSNSADWQCDFSAITFGSYSIGLIANGVTWTGAANITSAVSTQYPRVRYTTGAARLVGTFDVQ